MPRATRTSSVNTSGKEDDENSVEYWGRQTKESLVLKCNVRGLDAKGNKLCKQGYSIISAPYVPIVIPTVKLMKKFCIL